MLKKRWYVFVSGCLFLIFVGFSYLVHKNLFTQFDFNATVRLQDHMSRRFDGFFSTLSLIGSFEVTGSILLIVLICLFIYKRKWLWSLSVIFFFGMIHIFELYGKTFVKHFPPPHFMLRTQLPFNFPQFYVSEENSYPSGHAGRALFVTTLIALLALRSRKLTKQHKLFIILSLVLYDVLMCVSRVYLAEHWTTDVIGGSLLGTSFAIISGVFL